MLQLLSSACYPQWVSLQDPFTSDMEIIQLLKLWFLCQPWDLSLVSSPGPAVLWFVARHLQECLAGLIRWFVCRYFLGSCIHPRCLWAFGTLKQQCQHPDLRGSPSKCSSWGDRYGHRAQGACADHHQRRGEEGGRGTASPHEPIPPPLTLRSGREGHRAFRETWPAHRTPHTPLRYWIKEQGIEITYHAHRLET